MISKEDAQPKCFSISSAVPAGFFTPSSTYSGQELMLIYSIKLKHASFSLLRSPRKQKKFHLTGFNITVLPELSWIFTFFFFSKKQRTKETMAHTSIFLFLFLLVSVYLFSIFFLSKGRSSEQSTYYALLLQFQWPPRAPWLLIHLGHTRIALIHQINNIKHCIGRTAPPTTKTRKKKCEVSG